MASLFYQELTQRIAADMSQFQSHNVDPLRFPTRGNPYRMIRQHLLDGFDRMLQRAGYVRFNPYQRERIADMLSCLKTHADGLSWLYDRLADDYSRRILIEVLVYRVLGHRHTRLSRNNGAYANAVDELFSTSMTKSRAAKTTILDGWLDDYEVRMDEGPIKLRAHKLNILNSFLLEQYRFDNGAGTVIEAIPDDIVVDGGGCWGDTALYFARKVGEAGQVHVFEFSDENLVTLNQNLQANPDIKDRIHVHAEALWNESNQILAFTESGPATQLNSSTPSTSTKHAITRTLDDWAHTTSIHRLDFVKLDVEGAEAHCLEGARVSIQRFQPKLAVALYHSLADFVNLPQLIDQINPDYRFHLGHFTIHEEETILFATPSV